MTTTDSESSYLELNCSIGDNYQKCAQTVGIPLAGAGALMGMQAGAITVPGVGSIPGAVAGFLAGLFSGTMMCTAVNIGYRNELRELLE